MYIVIRDHYYVNKSPIDLPALSINLSLWRANNQWCSTVLPSFICIQSYKIEMQMYIMDILAFVCSDPSSPVSLSLSLFTLSPPTYT